MPAGFRTRLGDYSRQLAHAALGQLISARTSSGFASQYLRQVEAWEEQLELLDGLRLELTAQLQSAADWTLLLEYPIPRRNKYPDAILLAVDVIFVLEFKIGAIGFDAAAKWQAEDYAFDLRDFHEGSRGRTIIPILIATQSTISELPLATDRSLVWPVSCLSFRDLSQFVVSSFQAAHSAEARPIGPTAWEQAIYRPVLSIVEAASGLFTGHSVREISHAYADNLTATTDALVGVVHSARQNDERAICFVTGVPGAGKTLAGLNLVH